MPVEVGHDDPVVAGVGDEEPLAGLVGQDLAGEEQAGIVSGFSFSGKNLSGVSLSVSALALCSTIELDDLVEGRRNGPRR